jgi:hypothetical protein
MRSVLNVLRSAGLIDVLLDQGIRSRRNGTCGVFVQVQ